MNSNVLGRLTIVYTTRKLPWEDSGSIYTTGILPGTQHLVLPLKR